MTDTADRGASRGDVIARAQRDYDYERAAAWKHVLQCRWCLGGLCPMARDARANADAYGRHLDALKGAAS